MTSRDEQQSTRGIKSYRNDESRRSERSSSPTDESVNNWSERTLNKEIEYSDDVYERLDADKLVDTYGTWGRYQMLSLILIQLANFPYAASLYVMTYLTLDNDRACYWNNHPVKLQKESWEACHINDDRFPNLTHRKCLNEGGQTGFLFRENDTLPVHSMLVEFNLTCDSIFFKESGVAVFTIAAMLIVPFTSIVADHIGRKPVIVVSITVAAISNAVVYLVPGTLWAFLLCRFICGAASDTYLSIASVATAESMSSKARNYVTILYCLFWSCGMFWVGITSLYIRNWRLYYLVVTAPGILFVLYQFVLSETPHYLIQKKNLAGIKTYIQRANKMNKVTINLYACLKTMEEAKSSEGCKEIWTSPTIIKYFAINGLITGTMSLLYFAISFLSVELSSDKFKDFMLSAAVEIPGGIITLPLMQLLGRRIITSISIAFQAICITCSALPWVREDGWLMEILMLSTKFINSVTYGVHPIWANELMPTSIRSQAYSIVNIPQSIGIILSPYLRHFKKIYTMPPIAAFCFVCAGLCFLMPETKERPMVPDLASLKTANSASNASLAEDKDEILNGATEERRMNRTEQSDRSAASQSPLHPLLETSDHQFL